MQWFAQLIAQVILLVLPKFVNEFFENRRREKEDKKLEEENKKKGENYANASIDGAHDEFSKLP